MSWLFTKLLDSIHSWNDEQHVPFRQWKEGVNHTRIYHAPMEGVCSSAYAVTQAGARKLLYHVGVRGLDAAYDIMLRDYCAGKDAVGGGVQTCITVQPALMHQFTRNREESDISESLPTPGDQEDNDIRWSMRQNLPQFMRGSEDWVDKLPDTFAK